MQPLISVILPIYGVEEYLDECIQSVVAQTYQNIEIILVDDGSKDRCPQIIDEWAAKDARIRPIHKENGGQSSARNCGLEIAKGDYITFVDSDDYVELEYCEQLLHTIQRYDADIAVGSFTRVTNKAEIPAPFFDQPHQIYYACDINQAAGYFLKNFIAVWGKLYRAQVLRDIRFPQGRLAEEYAFQLHALMKSKTVGFCNRHLYKYRIRANSDAHSIKSKYLLDNIYAIDEAYEICRQHFPEETAFCIQHLAKLLYEYTAAERFGAEVSARDPQILEHALETVGGEDRLLATMEQPLDTLFYTYSQFYPHLTNTEKNKIQADYRKMFSWRSAKAYGKQFFLKYLPSYISLRVMTAVSRKIR